MNSNQEKELCYRHEFWQLNAANHILAPLVVNSGHAARAVCVYSLSFFSSIMEMFKGNAVRCLNGRQSL